MPKINAPYNNNEFSLTERKRSKLVFPNKRLVTRERAGLLGDFDRSNLSPKQKRSREQAKLKDGGNK